MNRLNYSKLGWHKRHIVSCAYDADGKYGYFLADNKQLRQLIEWGWLEKDGEWGKYKLTAEGKAAYERG